MFNNNVKVLLFFSLLFLVIRFSILFTSLDKVYEAEGIYTGTIPKELLEGLKIPLFDYQYSPEAVSSIAIGILAVPFYLLFGSNYFALKLTILLTNLSNFMLWCIFTYIFFNKRVALFLAILFILAPPLWLRFSSFAAPTIEPLTTLAILFFFQAIYGCKKQKQNMYYFIAMGLVSGMAIWIYPSNSIPILICLLFWFALDKFFIFKRYFFSFFTSLIIGFSPWIYYNITHGFAGFYRYGKPLYSLFLWQNILYPLQGLKDFIVHILSNSYWLTDFFFIKRLLLNNTYNSIFIISFLMLSWQNRRAILELIKNIVSIRKSLLPTHNISTKETFVLFYIIIYILIYKLFNFIRFYGYSDFLFIRHLRFLSPIFPFVFLTIALFLDKIWMNTTKLFLLFSRLVLIVLIFMGIMGSLSLVSFDLNKFGRCLKEDGFCYGTFGIIIGKKFGYDMGKAISIIEQVDKQQKSWCYCGLGMAIAEQYNLSEDDLDILMNRIDKKGWYSFSCGYFFGKGAAAYGKPKEQFINLRNQLEVKHWPYFYNGLGLKIVVQNRLPNGIKSCIESIEKNIDERYKPWCFEGAGKEIGLSFLISDIKELIQEISQVNEKYRGYIYKGFGWGLAIKINPRNISLRIKDIEYIPNSYKDRVYQGLGEGLYLKYRYEIKRCLEMLNKVDPEYRAYIYKGLGYETGSEHNYDLDVCKNIINDIDKDYRIYFLEGFKENEGITGALILNERSKLAD